MGNIMHQIASVDFVDKILCYSSANLKLKHFASVLVMEQIYTNCTSPLETGEFCLDAGEQERFRHDPATAQCVPFDYKGCGGNNNNYYTKWECEMSCGKYVTKITTFLPLENHYN